MSSDDEDDAGDVEAGLTQLQLAKCITEIACAYFTNNKVEADDVGSVIEQITAAIAGTGGASEEPAEEETELTPAVPIKRSITDEHLVCLECGKHAATLKRHLDTKHDLTPEAYRQKWGLRADYPMAAPAYSRKRSAETKARGFGRKEAA